MQAEGRIQWHELLDPRDAITVPCELALRAPVEDLPGDAFDRRQHCGVDRGEPRRIRLGVAALRVAAGIAEWIDEHRLAGGARGGVARHRLEALGRRIAGLDQRAQPRRGLRGRILARDLAGGAGRGRSGAGVDRVPGRDPQG